MAAFLNVCRFTPTAGGTTDWTYSSAVTGYQSPAAAGAVSGRLYKYRAESTDLSQWEIGEGAYNTGTGVLARTAVLFNSAGTTSKINFSAAPQVAIVALKEDLLSIEEPNAFTTAQKAQARSNIEATGIGRAINGLVPANNATTPNTALDIPPGNARDKDLSVDLVLSSGFSKTTGAWVAGTGNGALDTGAVAASAGYHVHLIYNPGTLVTDILFSTSATAPTMPSGYTKRRRIGAFITDASGFIKKGVWRGDGSFELTQPITVASARSLTNQSLLTLPLGVKLKLKFSAVLASTTGGNPPFYGIVRDPDAGVLANDALQWQAGFCLKPSGANSLDILECWTNTSGQVYTWSYSGDANNQIYIYQLGWLDLRDEFS